MGLTPEHEQYLADVREHLEQGGEPFEVEQVDDECPTCGAWMLNPSLHESFHRRQREQFQQLDHLARQYVSPPRYG